MQQGDESWTKIADQRKKQAYTNGPEHETERTNTAEFRHSIEDNRRVFHDFL
jgi:hypothetical protein